MDYKKARVLFMELNAVTDPDAKSETKERKRHLYNQCMSWNARFLQLYPHNKPLSQIAHWARTEKKIDLQQAVLPEGTPYYCLPTESDTHCIVAALVDWATYYFAIMNDRSVSSYVLEFKKKNIREDLNALTIAQLKTNPLWKAASSRTTTTMHIPTLGIVDSNVLELHATKQAQSAAMTKMHRLLGSYFDSVYQVLSLGVLCSQTTITAPAPVVDVVDNQNHHPGMPEFSTPNSDSPLWVMEPRMQEIREIIDKENKHRALLMKSSSSHWTTTERDLEMEIENVRLQLESDEQKSFERWQASMAKYTRIKQHDGCLHVHKARNQKMWAMIQAIRSHFVKQPLWKSIMPIHISQKLDDAVTRCTMIEVKINHRLLEKEESAAHEADALIAWHAFVQYKLRADQWTYLLRLLSLVGVSEEKQPTTFSRSQTDHDLKQSASSYLTTTTTTDDKDDKDIDSSSTAYDKDYSTIDASLRAIYMWMKTDLPKQHLAARNQCQELATQLHVIVHGDRAVGRSQLFQMTAVCEHNKQLIESVRYHPRFSAFIGQGRLIHHLLASLERCNTATWLRDTCVLILCLFVF